MKAQLRQVGGCYDICEPNSYISLVTKMLTPRQVIEFCNEFEITIINRQLLGGKAIQLLY